MLRIPSPLLKFKASRLRCSLVLPILAAVLPMLAPAVQAQVIFNGVQTQVAGGVNPSAVAVDGSGNVYFLDYVAGTVNEMLAVNGSVPASPVTNVLASGFSQPAGVAVDHSGNVYVADQGTAKVSEIEAVDGSIPASPTIRQLGSGFVSPAGVAVDASGDVYVGDDGVGLYEMFAVGGVIPASPVTIFLAGGFQQPGYLAMDASGDMAVVDAANSNVYEYIAVGGSIPITATPHLLASGSGVPGGVAMDAVGNIYVTDLNTSMLRRLLAVNGIVPDVSPTVETLASNLSIPAGVAVDANGNVYVGELNNSSVDQLALGSIAFNPQAIGSPGTPISLPFTIDAGTTVGSVAVLTGGVQGLDFADAGGSTCIPNTYATQASCTVNVALTPSVSGLRQGAVVFFSGAGNTGTVLASVPLYGVGTGSQVVFNPGTQTTLNSSLNTPQNIAVDGSGNIYVADSTNNSVEEIMAAGGYTTVVPLGGTYPFNNPIGVAVDGAGNVYASDYNNSAVVEIPAGCVTSACVAQLGGVIGGPKGVAVDLAGNVFVAAGNGVSEIRPGCAASSCVAALGGGFSFLNPYGVAVDASGNVFVTDSNNLQIEEILASSGYTTVNVLTGAGYPQGIAVDANGNLFFASGTINELQAAGGYTNEFPVSGNFGSPEGVAVDGHGNLYVSSGTSIYKVDRADGPTLSFPTLTFVGTPDIPDGTVTAQVFNTGNQPLNFTAVAYPIDFVQDTSDVNACSASTPVAAGGECDVPLQFAPGISGSLNEPVTLTDDALNNPGTQQSVTASGIAVVMSVITWNPPSPIQYGTPLDATELNATASDSGTLVYSPPAGTVLPVGTSLLSITFTPSDPADFSSASASVPITVINAPGTTPFGPVNVGAPSTAMSFSFLLTSPVTLGPNSVLTLGVSGLDFSDAGTGTCVSGNSYNAGATCTVDVIFTPAYSGLRQGAVLINDNSGNVVGTVYISGIGNGPQVAFNSGALSSIGSSIQGAEGVAVDGAGNLYVADFPGAAVYKITPGGVQTPIGSGWTAPAAVAVDGAGNLFVADFYAGWVVEIAPGGTQTVLNIPGLYGPTGLAFDGAGILYVVDEVSATVYKVAPCGCATPIGSGFNDPFAIALDNGGNVYVADDGNSAIYKIATDGTQTTFKSNLHYISGLAVDPAGNVYASSQSPKGTNPSQPIYEIAPNGTRTTILETGLVFPAGLALDGAGNLYIAYSNEDELYDTSEITKLDRADVPAIVFPTATAVGSADTVDGALSAIIQNIGNAALTIPVPASGTNPMLTGDSFIAGASTCPVANAGDLTPKMLAEGTTCQLTVSFTPLTGGLLTGAFALTDNNLNAAGPAYATQSIALSGSGMLISWPPPAPIASGTALSATQLDATASVSGTFVYTPAAGTVLPVGVQTLSATFTPDNLGLYPATTLTVPITVLAPFTIAETPVGGSSALTPFTFTFSSPVTLGPDFVSTQGQFGLDFTDAGTGTCTNGTSYNAGDSCTVNVTFTPLFAGLREGAIQLYDSSFNLIATDYISGMGQAPQIVFGPGTETVIAAEDPDYPQFLPSGTAVDAAGNLYVADEIDGAVFMMPLIGGSYGPQIPLATLTTNGFNFYPSAVAVDGAGNVFVADEGNTYVSGSVFEIPWNGASYGPEVTIASSTTFGFGPVFQPISLAVDASGNVYFADSQNGDVVKVPLTGSTYGPQLAVASIATNGSNFFPFGIAVDAGSNVYIADYANAVVTEAPWTGSGYGAQTTLINGATPPSFLPGFFPIGVALDGTGDVYISDPVDAVVAKLPFNGSTFGSPVPVTGHNSSESLLDPCGITVDQAGNLFIPDCTLGGSSPQQVVKIDLTDAPSVNFPTATGYESIDTADGPSRVFVANIGNQPLTLAGVGSAEYPANFPENASDTHLCSDATPVAQGAICQVSMNFYPTSLGPNSGAIQLTDNTLNQAAASQSILLSGIGQQGTPAITWPTPAAIYKGTPLSATQLDATTTVSGTFVYTPPLGTVLGIGPRTLSVTFTPDDAVDYTSNTATVQLTVNADVAAVLTAPTPGSTLAGPSVTFTWSAASGATGYQLWVGSTGAYSNDIYSSGQVMDTSFTSVTVTLPTNGEMIYARLFTGFNGTWKSLAYTFTAANEAAAALTTPAPGSTLGSPNTTFSWTPGTGAAGYQLWLGSTGPGSNDIYSSGQVLSTSFLSVSRTNLPVNGGTIYARLFTDFNGTWVHQDYTYTAAKQAAMTSPTPASTLTGASATFNWAAGTGASGYQLWLGSSGPGSNDIYSSGIRVSTSFTSVTVNNLPTNGETVYVRLFTLFGSVWTHQDYTYTAQTWTQAALTSPAPASTLPGPSVTFTWSAGSNATGYQLWLGSTAGTTDLFSTGEIESTSFTSVAVPSLPTNGETIHVRLFTDFGGVWKHVDYSLTAATTPAMISPVPGSQLSGPSAVFTWSAGTGVTAYQLWLGSTGKASNNLFSSGMITDTTVTANNLPTNGQTIYARLYMEIGGVWSHEDYIYTAGTAPALTSPAPGSTLASGPVTFQWSPGTGVTAYKLWLGSGGVASNDIYTSGEVTGTSVTVNHLPSNGETINARLWVQMNGVWSHLDYTYTAAD